MMLAGDIRAPLGLALVLGGNDVVHIKQDKLMEMLKKEFCFYAMRFGLWVHALAEK